MPIIVMRPLLHPRDAHFVRLLHAIIKVEAPWWA